MKKYTGLLGFVILPDNKTKEVLKELSKKYSLKDDVLPQPHHLSLYHGNLLNFPDDKVRKLLQQLKFLFGNKYVLKQIEPYGEKFLFWDVSKPFLGLQRAHESIVKVIAQYVDHEKTGIALKEELKIPEKELSNIKRYSHPLVKDLFRPHYSLLYRKKDVKNKNNKEHVGIVKEIQFVEIGGFSKINRVFASIK